MFDDGPVKPVRIWSRIGRRPIVAGGNSNGDMPMLRFAGGARPALRLLVLHDDAEREFDYTAGAETALERAAADGWTVVSMKDDWGDRLRRRRDRDPRLPIAPWLRGYDRAWLAKDILAGSPPGRS